MMYSEWFIRKNVLDEISEEDAFLHAKTQAEQLFKNRKNTNKGAVEL